MLIVADRTEDIEGTPLFVKLVENGRIINPEDMNFRTQAERTNETWNRYKGFTLSPKIKEWKATFEEMKNKAVSGVKNSLEIQ
jgi:nicotinate phosphoribosyltransferase